jgi:SAM-dependent methyltransferase
MVLELSSAQDISQKGVSPMPDSVVDAVRSRYAAVAESTLSSDHAGVRAVAQAFGYSPEELAAIPKDANMGLSCGNPTAMASLKPGETVVDLGCGGGLDVFLASQKVGAAGKGIDMTPSMIARAQKNAQEGGFRNVEFHLATIDHLPLPDASVDVVISNCVINLAPDKPAVFREIARILKPGGRLAVSDIALKQPLPAELAQDVMAYVGCIAGALLIPDYQRQLLAAGFAHVQVIDSARDLNAYAKVENQSACCAPAMAAPPAPTSCCAPAPKPKPSAKSCCCGGGEASAPPAPPSNPDLHARLKDLLTRYNVNDFAASVKVFAGKP